MPAADAPVSKKEPLSEGLAKARRPCGFFSRMNNRDVALYAKKVMREKGTKYRTELYNEDPGLYDALRKRGLLDNVGFHRKRRKDSRWRDKDNDEVLASGKNFILMNAITKKCELERANPTLHSVLKRRKLLDRPELGLEQKKRNNWRAMSDDELLNHVDNIVKDERLGQKSELENAHGGLYCVLQKRKLLGRIKFLKEKKERAHGFFSSMADAELVDYTKAIMKESGIDGRGNLEKLDSGLYQILRKRGLLDMVSVRKRAQWKLLNDEELFEQADAIMKEEKIGKKTELKNSHPALYQALCKRNLIDSLFGTRRLEKRHWKSMRDDELVNYSKRFMEERTITRRTGLRKADNGLYNVLLRRNLLDRVFRNIERLRLRDARLKVVEALERFGDAP